MSFMFSRIALNEDLFAFSRLFHHYDDASTIAAPPIASFWPFVAGVSEPPAMELDFQTIFAPPTLSQHYMLSLAFDDSLFAPIVGSPFERPGLYPLKDGDGGYLFG